MKNLKLNEDTISIVQIYKRAKPSYQIYGPHAFYEDGTRISFNEQMAIISHYLHNRGTEFGKPYEKKAKELMADIEVYMANHPQG